jgi:hypothetical protein
MFNGGINTDLTFPTLQQCETVAAQAKKNGVYRSFCVEQQVKQKKLNCKIENRTDYVNHVNKAHNLDYYPYPVGISCVEKP